MKKLFLVLAVAGFVTACNNSSDKKAADAAADSTRIADSTRVADSTAAAAKMKADSTAKAADTSKPKM